MRFTLKPSHEAFVVQDSFSTVDFPSLTSIYVLACMFVCVCEYTYTQTHVHMYSHIHTHTNTLYTCSAWTAPIGDISNKKRKPFSLPSAEKISFFVCLRVTSMKDAVELSGYTLKLEWMADAIFFFPVLSGRMEGCAVPCPCHGLLHSLLGKELSVVSDAPCCSFSLAWNS